MRHPLQEFIIPARHTFCKETTNCCKETTNCSPADQK